MKSDPLYKYGDKVRIALQFAAAMNKPITPQNLIEVFPHKFNPKNSKNGAILRSTNLALKRLQENGHINPTQHGWLITDAGKEHLRTYAKPYKGEKE